MSRFRPVLACTLLLFAILFSGCFKKENQKPSLQCLLAVDADVAKFSQADRARNTGDYSICLKLYDSLLGDQNSISDRNYANWNKLFCTVLASDTISQIKLPPIDDAMWATSTLKNTLVGILETRNGRSALTQLHAARKALIKNDKKNTFEYFVTLESLGRHHLIVKGQIDSAAFYYRESLQLARSFEELAPHMPRILLALGNISLIDRDEISGLDFVDEAVQRSTSLSAKAEAFILKGTLLRKLKRYDSTDFYYNRAEGLIQRDKSPYLFSRLLSEQILQAIILNRDSLFHLLMDRLDGVGPNYSKGGYVNIDRLWGYYFLEKGDLLKSTTYYENALKRFSSCKTADPVQVMEAFYALASHYTKLHNFSKAENVIVRALVYNSSFRNEPLSWANALHREVTGESYSYINYNLLANIYTARYNRLGVHEDLMKSMKLYKLVDSLMFQQVRVVEEDALIDFLAIGHEVYSGGIETLFHLYKHTEDTAYINLAHSFMEKGKSLIMYRDILVHNNRYFPEVPSDFKQREIVMKARISALKKTHAYGSRELSEYLKKMNAYYEEMRLTYPRYYRAKYDLNIPSLNHVAKQSNDNMMSVIQYHATPDYLYFIKYDHPFQFGRIKMDSSFHQSIRRLRQLLEKAPDPGSEHDRESFMKASANIYSRLIDPLHELRSKILIIPDGTLNFIPFEVLVKDPGYRYDNAPYLIRNHECNYTPSFRVYDLTSRVKDHRSKKILGYSFTKGYRHLGPLHGTQREIESIQRIFGNYELTLRSDKMVTRSRVLQDLELPFDIIHIGLHASSSLTDRLENKIYCYPGRVDTTSTIFGYEIAPMNVKANIVVITACSSGYGPVVQGEGTYSLARAFKQTGVTNVVSSLWDLTDNSTAKIIDGFYNQIHEGNSASESLTIAKRNYLSNADEMTAHPYFWSSLICQGR